MEKLSRLSCFQSENLKFIIFGLTLQNSAESEIEPFWFGNKNIPANLLSSERFSLRAFQLPGCDIKVFFRTKELQAFLQKLYFLGKKVFLAPVLKKKSANLF